MKTIIISGGCLSYDFAETFIKEEKPDCLIAADKGMQFCFTRNIVPDYVLGDFDSAKQEMVTHYRTEKSVHMIEFQPEKDDTDTEIAFKKALELGSDRIVLLGALGGRMDHCIANIHLLKFALEQKVTAALVDEQNYMILLDSAYEITRDKQWGKYVSFLPFTDQVEGLTLEGFKYPLHDYTMKKGLSIGVSNEIEKETASVTMRDGILLMIQSKDL